MPNIFDYLAFRARFEPGAVALQRLSRQRTFADVHFLVKRIAARLRKAGVRPGQLVVTAIPDRGLDWQVTLALFHEACVTCSNHFYAPWTAPFAYDWMITNRHEGSESAGNVIVVDDDWLKAAQDEYEEIAPIDYDSEDSVVRVVLTSGTTGRRKGVPLTHRHALGRARASMMMPGAFRILSLIGLSTAGDFNAALAALMVGAPVYACKSPQEAVQVVVKHGVECLLSPPAAISTFIDDALQTGHHIESVKVARIAGASPSPQLVKKIEEHLTRNIVVLYGSTEAGGMAAIKATSRTPSSVVGYPQVDSRIEVVGDDDVPLPAEQIGRVRVKTAWAASSYLGEPEASADAFKDGWFYPGDTGLLREDGLLVLAGRDDEVVNLGGVKRDPVLLDNFLTSYDGVKDAAVFADRSQEGVDRFVAGIVVEPGFDVEALAKAAREKFGKGVAPVAYVRMRAIRRNAMGKPMRAEMSETYAARKAKSA